MPPPPKTTTPELDLYGLPKLGYDRTNLPFSGDVKRDQVLVESLCFRIGHKSEEGGLGKFGHLKNYVDALWNAPDSGSMKRCIWNPWANRMFMKMCEEPELVIAGPTSAGKSDPVALYALVSYLTDPTHTLVLVLSTTIAGAKKRIWKTMREYWDSVPNLPGKPLWSTNEVRGLNYQGDGYGESSGMYLLASEKSNEKAAMDKLIGLKSPRTGTPGSTYEELLAQPEYADLQNHFDEETLRDLIPRLNNLSNDRIGKIVMCVDEATGAVDSLISAVRTNLQPGNVGSFQIIWIGNPASPYDVLGQAARPEGGWDSVDLIKDDEWRTDTGGLCIRFNGELNPRLTDPEGHKYSWMLRQEDIDKMAKTYGKESLFYHRMVLGTWCLTAGESAIYSAADIEISGSRRNDVIWGYDAQTPASFLDPSFTAGGDRAMASFGKVGTDINGEHVFLLMETKAIKVDVNNTTTPISYQIVHGWKKECRERGILPQHAAFDSGGAPAFADIVRAQWSPLVTAVTSAGPASKNPLPGEFKPGTKDPILACDRFANRASEIWHSAMPLFRSRQIFGVTEDLAKELCSRQLDKRGGVKICIEPKPIYRSREGKSPDESDSFLGLVDFCRTKFKLLPTERQKARAEQSGMTEHGKTAWEALRARARRITDKRRFKG